ncbi:hypothetical protein BKA64DRAFT_710238 [Cadophora sp. MPI-SDFR-AT-0126]|nr:hypothetical protein BKA64DRAFT_710238 [Leotiomycetes sp. MPI-SDFR-AT-0126]
MDPISTTLSVIPLVLQLGKGINKLSGFLQSIQDAPAEIEWILEELDFLEVILNQIKLNDEVHGPQSEVQRALQRCMKPLRAIDKT